MGDLSKCPQCGGDADRGIDNCIPPSAYMCSNCCAQEDEGKAASVGVDERPDDPHLPEFHKDLHAGYKGSFYEWHKEHFGSFWCTGVAA